MIKSYDVLWPPQFPYRLVSFEFYFENVNSRMLNLYHAAGMHFIYEQVRICYLFPQNEFYELLRLQNIREPHDKKYNAILMKGTFGGEPPIAVDLVVENEEALNLLPCGHFDTRRLSLHKLPEEGDEMVFTDKSGPACFHHFACRELSRTPNGQPSIHLVYLESCKAITDIINPWLGQDEQLVLS